MPNVTTLTTGELITIVADYVGEDGQAAFTELKNREIKTGDADCDEGTYKTRGGIRPHHAPIVP